MNNIAPKPRKILQLLRLLQINNGIFIKVTKATSQMLQLVEPYVTYGEPNLKTVRELVLKRGYGKVNKQRIPLTDNAIIEAALGKHGVVSVEDVIHEIMTCGPAFKQVRRAVGLGALTDRSRSPPSCGRSSSATRTAAGGHASSVTSVRRADRARAALTRSVEGGDAGDREHNINSLVRSSASHRCLSSTLTVAVN